MKCLVTYFFFLFQGNNFLISFLTFHLNFLRLSCSINAHILHQTPLLSLVPASLFWSQGSAWQPLPTCSPPRGTCADESPSSPQAAGVRTAASASSVKPAFSVTYHLPSLCHAGQGCRWSFCWKFTEETYHQTLPPGFSCSTKVMWLFLPPATSSGPSPEREENAGSGNMTSFSLLHRVPWDPSL